MPRERFFLELPPPLEAMAAWPHVVIVGGGFAGVKAASALAGQPVRVTLIDKRNFNLFQPLLYQVATGLVAEADVATPLRGLLEKAANVQVLLGEVVDLDPANRELVFNDRRYRYDHLILATGSGSSYFGHEDWRAEAPPMKILENADEIRRRLLSAIEEAEQTPDRERRRFLQSVVVIGGAWVLLRLEPLIALSPLVQGVLVVVGGTTALVAALIALGQIDVKRALSFLVSSWLGLL